MMRPERTDTGPTRLAVPVSPSPPQPADRGAGGGRLLDPEEVAQRLHVSRDHVFRLMKTRQLTFVRIGRFYRVDEADLTAFIAAHRSLERPADWTVVPRPRRLL